MKGVNSPELFEFIELLITPELQPRLVRTRTREFDEDGNEEAPRSKIVPGCYPLLNGDRLKVKL